MLSGNNKSFVVTVDGPAASGKTSVSRELARRLGCEWVSTGAFYRGLAYAAYKTGIPASDKEALIHLAGSKAWSIRMSDEKTHVIFNGQDVTHDIAAEEVGEIASQISQIPEIRKALLKPQRDCAQAGKGLVAEGRDCGTVVFPQAEVKVFLTADPAKRALRRATEFGVAVDGIMQSQKQRDHQDSTRKAAPLKLADGAVTVDTSEMNLDEVIAGIETLVRDRLSL